MVWLGGGVADHADRGSDGTLGDRRDPPAAVRGCGGRVAKSVRWGSSPLVHDRAVAHVRIVPRLGPLDLHLQNTNTNTNTNANANDLHLLVLDVHVVLRNGSVHCRVVLETEEAEAPSFLLLLVVHYHHLQRT